MNTMGLFYCLYDKICIMQINDVSGVIYPNSSRNIGSDDSVNGLGVGGDLCGSNAQDSDYVKDKLASGFQNVLYAGDSTNLVNNSPNQAAEDGTTHVYKDVSDTSIDRTGDIRIEEDVSVKLNEYRKQISESWA